VNENTQGWNADAPLQARGNQDDSNDTGGWGQKTPSRMEGSSQHQW